jgi:ABC-type nitrate/sulfonate/bicarbonate transport system permease component
MGGVSAAVFYPILYRTIIGVRVPLRATCGQFSGWQYELDRLVHGAGLIFAGLKLGVVIGMATLLAAEMFASSTGLEFVINGC